MVSNEVMTTTDITDEVLDSTAAALTDTLATPSRIARKAGITTTECYAALAWLVENRQAVATGNGAWTKYRNRQFGEKIR
jgi:post-segregation antitoxin (ccd killing protein)